MWVVGPTVVNHMLYADDIVLFAPSAKGLQKLLDLSHTYGCNHDIEFNPSKSCVMYIDSRKAGNAQSMTISRKTLNVVTSFSYLGHIICNDLSDDADLKAKARQMYAKINTLRQKCSRFLSSSYAGYVNLAAAKHWLFMPK